MGLAAVKDWFVYMVECADKSLYTGITTDIERRLIEHNSDDKGARYTRMRRPVKLVYTQTYNSRSLASKRECAIKKLNRRQKQILIAESSCKN